MGGAAESRMDGAGPGSADDGWGAGSVLGLDDDAHDATKSAIPNPAQFRMAFPVQCGSASQVGSSATEPGPVFE